MLKKSNLYIEKLIEKFNDFLDSNDNQLGIDLYEACLYLLDDKSLNIEVEEVCYVIKKYFDVYLEDINNPVLGGIKYKINNLIIH